MSCTTILVGRKATNDGSTIMARNEDCENGSFNAKTMIAVSPEDQPRSYTGVNSHLTMELPDDPLRYVCVPNVDKSGGIWAEAGINAANVAMTATETISSNSRVLGADPLVCYQPAKGKPGEPGYQPEQPGGIGEEDLVTIVLPYIHTAKEGVERMAKLLEEYGTYEMNGVAFCDDKDVWYIETIGGHHWIARRVPDDCYVVQPNRMGIDRFDFDDAFGEQNDYLCSADLPAWMVENHLDVSMHSDEEAKGEDRYHGLPAVFNPRYTFSSYTWLDMVYNNPRAWYLGSRINPSSPDFHGPDAKYGPESMDIDWCRVPECKLSVLDVKDLLGTTYNGTIYNCYGTLGTPESRHQYRNVGINRTCECSILNIRPYAPKAAQGVQWVAYGSGPFNTAVAMFSNVKHIPDYLVTPEKVTTDSLYWTTRLVSGLADPEYFDNMQAISGYEQETMAAGYENLHKVDAELRKLADEKGLDLDSMDDEAAIKVLEDANQALSDKVEEAHSELLGTALFVRSLNMSNAFGSNDH